MSCYALLLVICGLFEYGSPIMCYECNSAINPQCIQSVLPDSFKRNCSEHDRGAGDRDGVEHVLCRKIVQHIDVTVHGQVPAARVIRGCGWDESKYKDSCYHRAGYGGRQEVCSCSKDYCNNSTAITPILTLTVGSCLMTILKLVCQ